MGTINSQKFERFLWLMPIAFAIHIPEEYAGGFPNWIGEYLHGSMSDTMFWINNAVFMAIMVTLAFWASCSRSYLSAFIFLGWASGNLFWDFIFHLGTTAYYDRYSPGLISVVILYYPISIMGTQLALKGGRTNRAGVVGSYIMGAALLLFVIWAGLYHFHNPLAQ